MRTVFKVLLALTVLLIGLFLLARYVFFPIVPIDHLYDKVPIDEGWVLIADTEGLLDLTFKNLLSDPSSIKRFETEDEEDDDDERLELEDLLKRGLWNGLEIPERLICWKEHPQAPLFYTILPLSDSEKFQELLTEEKERTGLLEVLPGEWRDSTTVILIQPDHLLLTVGEDMSAYSSKTEMSSNVSSVLASNLADDILRVYHISSGVDSEQAGVKEVQLISKAGRFDFVIEMYEPLEAMGMETLDEGIGQLAIMLDIPASYQQKTNPLAELIDKTGLSPEQVDSLFTGRVALRLDGLTASQEEFVTYTYNDDFEKVAHTEVQEIIHADFQMDIGTNQSIDSLMYERGWVKLVDGRPVFVMYPLQEVYYHERREAICISSSPDFSDTSIGNYSESHQFLQLDVQGLESAWNSKQDSSKMIFTGINHIQGMIESSGQALRIQLHFQDAERQGLFSLLELQGL